MPRKPRDAGAQIVGVIRLSRTTLMRASALQGVFMVALLLPANPAVAQLPANARPQGGAVVAGSASITRSPTTTSINQSSQNAAINWTTFNVGSSQSVKFNQPNSRSITLNRVTGADPSQIAGHIIANGTIVLTNPYGVVFAQGAEVNAASVLVTTAGISNQNLMAGKMVFNKPGKANAMVVNRGTITVAQAGLAALVAPAVVNSGVINARMGNVVLAGARTATLDLYGDGLVSIDVTKQVVQAPIGPNGKTVSALVTNTGVIQASGGTVQLTAAAVDGIVTNLVDAGGRIAANTTASGKTGTIVVSGIGGSLTIAGDLSAAGRHAGTTGGSIELDASNAVTVASTARVNASGKAGGGTVAIGTTLARAAGGASVTSTLTAKTTTIAAGAKVSANATRNGRGGKVTVLSTSQTTMAGSISAMGGAAGGAGGAVEISGEGGFSLTGSVDVSARMGNAGTILLDPANLTITHTGNGSLDGTLTNTGSVTYSDSANGSDTVTNSEIDGLNGNIVLQAGTALTVDNATPIILQPNASLTLQTQSGNITVGTSSPITASGTGDITMLAGTVGSGASISLGSNLTTDAHLGGITLQADAGINLHGVTLTTGLLDLTSLTSGGVSQTTSGVITADTLLSSGGIAGQVSLLGSLNAIGTLGAIAASGGLTLTNAASLTVAGLVNSGTVIINDGTFALDLPGTIVASAASLSAGSINVGGTLDVTGTAALIASTGSIGETGALSAGTLTGSAATTASFTGTNAITTLGSFAATSGSFSLTNSVSVTVVGMVSGTSVALTAPAVMIGDNATDAGSLVARTGGSISIRTDDLTAGTAGGGLSAAGGTIEIAPYTTTDILALGAVSSAGTLGLVPVDFTITADMLRLGEVGGTTTAAGIIVAGSTDLIGVGTLDLETAGAVTQSAALTVGTLIGHVGSATLTAIGNTIGTLGSFSAPGGLTLTDGQNLSIAGAVSSNSGTVVVNDGGFALGLPGTIVASAASLSAASISLGGTLEVTGTAALIASTGSIGETGTLLAGTLTGSAGTTASFTGSNAIGTLASFNAPSGLTLTDGHDLSIAGAVSSNSGTVVVNDSGFALDLPGTVVASAASLSAASISLGGTLEVTGTAALIASTGSIGETGTLLAGTLTGSAGTTASFIGTNAIGTLASFNAPGGLTLTDGQDLSIVGAVSSTNGTVIINDGTFALDLPGTIVASAASLSAASISLGGTLEVTGTAALIASTGSIGETGTLLANTLTGGAGTTASFIGTNAIGTLASFNAPGGLTLTDGHDLSIAGTVSSNSGTVVVNDGGFALDLPGTIVASAASLSAVSISIGGTLDVTGTAALIASTGSIGETGTLLAGTLTGSAGTTASFIGTNAIGTLASFSAPGGLTLTDGEDLTIAGAIGNNSGTVVVNDGGFALDLPGTIVASAASLSAASISLGGTLDVTGTAALIASTGSIGETGTLLAGTLTGGAGTTASFTGTNAIGTLASFSAPGGLTLTDGHDLSIAGAISSTSGTVIINDGGFALDLPGTIVASAATLSAASISIGGTLDVTGTAALIASMGSIGETGALLAGTLTGSAGTTASFTGSNAIGTLASFNAPGGLTLTDGEDLTIAGAISSNSGTVVVNDGAFALGLPGTILADAATLSAVSISIGGTLDVTGTAALIASTGSIGETGTLLAGTLTGSAGTTASFIGTNAIGTLGSFSAPGGLTLTDGQDLTIAGAVSSTGGTVIINDGGFALDLPGTIVASAASLSAASISLGGTLDVTGTATLIASPGSIGETGALLAGMLTGSAGTTASFTGTNAIATLGSFTAPGGLTLTDGHDLSIAGAVSSTNGTVIINDGGFALDLPGTIVASAASLSAASISLGGTLDVTGTAALIASSGGIGETGALLAGTLTGSAGTTASFTGTNAIATLGSFSAPGGLTLTDGQDLSIAGAVSSTSGTVIINDGGFALGLPGTIVASAASLSAASIDIGGTLDVTGTAALIASSGGIGETGALLAGTLTGSAGTTASFIGTNAIGTLASFSAPGGLTLADGHDLSIAGAVSSTSGTVIINDGTFALDLPGTIVASAASLSAGSINVGGTLDVTGTAALIASTGSIGETGALSAGTLTGSAATTASFTGTNAITTLGSFAATSGSFSLTNSVSVTVVGMVSGTSVALTAPAVMIGDNATDAGSLVARTGGSISIRTDDLTAGTAGGGLSAAGGTIEIAPYTTTDILALGAVSSAGTLGLVPVDFTITADMLRLGEVGGTTTAAGIIVAGSTDLIGVGTLDLETAGAVTQSAALTVGTLIGHVGSATLTAIGNTIGTLGSFSAPGGLTLTDGQNLSIAGAVSSNSGTVVVNDGGFALGLPGTIVASAASLSAASISLGGTLEVTGTAALIASTGSIGETGTLLAGTLTGSAGTTASFTGNNAIGTLASFSAPGGLTLTDGHDLSIAGAISSNSGTVVVNDGGFALDLPGTVVASAASLSAASISLGGTLDVTGTAALIASTGSIGETGTLLAGTLTGSAGTTASFIGTNAIGTLASFSAPAGLTLADGHDLSIAGAISSTSGTVIINDGGFALDLPGTIVASAASLSAASISLGGTLEVTGTAALIASTGSIGETGTLLAGTLTGSAGTTASFTGNNAIGTLASFSAPGGLTLTDGHDLSIAGAISSNSGTVVVNDDGFALDLPGTIVASAASLSAASISLGGTLDVTGTAALIASTGSIGETGTLLAGTLTGSAGTTASFIGTNAIGTLGSFSAPGGLTLADGQDLSIAGAISSTGGTVIINDGGFALDLPGTIVASAARLSAASISIGGTLDVTGTAALIASTGSIGETGTLLAGTLTGSAGTTASFTGSNAIGTLASFNAPGGLTLTDGHDLSIAGAVSSNSGTVVVNDGGFALDLPGTVVASAASLSAASISLGGTLDVTGTAALIASTGSIGETGTLLAGTLTGSAGTTASFIGTNAIGTLASFSAPAGLTLADGHDLSIAGPISSTSGTVIINDGGFALDLPGTIVASAASLSAASISLGGTLEVTGTAALIASTGSIGETGTLLAGTLTGSAGTTASFTGNNAIGTLASFSAPGGLTLTDGHDLSIAGAISSNSGTVVVNDGAFALGLPGTILADAATLSAVSISIGGTLDVTGTAALIASTGSIGETGTLLAGTLTGSAGTTASFTGNNAIGTLASFSAPGGLTLTDGHDLSIAGAISSTSGTVIINDGGFALGLPGTILANAATLSAASISIGGTLDVTGTAALIASMGSIGETGALLAGTLTGSAGTTASFTGSNAIGTLASFNAPGGLTLTDGEDLTIAGAISSNSGTVVVNDGAFALGLPGTILADAATLSAVSISIGGTLDVTGTAALIASTGSIGETGTLLANTLAGGAGTTASFIGNNTIGTLASFNAPGGLTLTDGQDLTIAGAISSTSGTVIINDGGFALDLPGTIVASAASLSAVSISIGGTLDVTGTAALIASPGSIGETGALLAGTLTGSAGTTASFTGTNAIATLGSFTAPGELTLTDGHDLSIAGAVSSTNGTVIINDGGFALDLPGTIVASAASLSAASISLGGTLDVTGTAALIASSGGIGETGALLAETLTGSAGTTANFTGTNAIGTLASFSAPGGLTLTDGQDLSIAGAVSSTSGTVIINDGGFALDLPGTIVASAASLSAASISLGGTLDVTGTAALTASPGSIGETGALLAGTLTGSAGTTASFTGTNAIATLRSFTAPGGLTLTDGHDLSIAGAVSSTNGTVIINDGAFALDLPGTIVASSASLSAASISIGGTLDVTGTAALIASPGGIGETGALVASTLTGSAGTTASFTGTNAIAALGSFTAPGGLTLTDGQDLSIAGAVSSTSGTVIINDGAFALDLPGTIVASAASLSAASISLGGTLDVTGTAALTASPGGIGETGALLAGTLTGSAGTTASFTGTNAIAALGSFTAPGGLTLTDGQDLSIAGAVSSTGGTVIINDGGFALDLPGAILANAATLFAASITIGGALDVTGTATLIASSGGIGETGALVASTLTGSAETAANFMGSSSIANSVGTLGTFTVGAGTLALVDATGLTTSGVITSNGVAITSRGALAVDNDITVSVQTGTLALTAQAITVSAGSVTLRADTMEISSATGISIGSGTTLDTGGDVFKRPPTDVAPVEPELTSPGAHFLVGTGGFQQTGLLTVQSYVAPNPVGAVTTVHPDLDIRLTAGGGTITFDPTSGLFAPTTDLLLTIGTGNATGRINADAVALFYSGQPVTPTTLSGTLRTAAGDPVSDQSAASEGFVAENNVYAPNTHFQVNSCAISSINCVVIPAFSGVPIINPITDLSIGDTGDQLDDPDLLLPNVSDRDY